MAARLTLAVVVGIAAMRVALPGGTDFLKGALRHIQPLRASVVLSFLGLVLTLRVVPHMKASFLRARLSGVDLNKATTKRDSNGDLVRPIEGIPIPEAMGAVSCAIYLICLFVFIPIPFAQPGVAPYAAPEFPHAELAKMLCALLSICCMCFLGFADNVLDLRWRDRLVLPLAASLPVIMTYAATGGVTVIKVPSALTRIVGVGATLDIGMLYYVYISMLAIFCTNAINILAGVNGLEVGQSVVIGLTMIIFNVVQVCKGTGAKMWCSLTPLCRVPTQMLRVPHDAELQGNSLFSLYVLMPFVFCSAGAFPRMGRLPEAHGHRRVPARVPRRQVFCTTTGTPRQSSLGIPTATLRA